MASSAVKIVLNAVDKYTPAIVGLNQGLELVGKAFNVVDKAAGLAFDGIKKGIDLAIKGGRFEEISNQFEHLADSMGVSAKEVSRQVRAIALDTISDYESIGIASKALAAKLTGKDLETILTFTKRYTESTGESFTQMSRTIFTALASGRTSTLKQMGLVLERGAKMSDVVQAAAKQLEKFGDAGFNAADKIDAINASQDDFIRKIGQAINNTPEFREILGSLANEARGLADAFNPKLIIPYISAIIQGVQSLYKYIVESGESVIGWMLGTQKPVEITANNIFEIATNVVERIVQSVAGGVNAILGFFQNLNNDNILSNIADRAVQLFTWVTNTALEAGKFVVKGLLKLVSGLFFAVEQGVQKLANSTDFLKKVGIDLNLGGALDSIRSIGDSLDNAIDKVDGFGSDFASGLEAISGASEKAFANTNDKIESLKINTEKISKYFGDIRDKAGEIKLGTSKQEAFDFGKLTAEAIKPIKAVQEETKKTIQKTIDLKQQYKNAFDVANAEYDRLSKKLALGYDVTGRKLTLYEQKDIERQLDDLRKKLTAGIKTKAELKIEYKTKNEAVKEMIKNVGGVNWPSAWKKMADAFMEMLIAAAAGEDIPLAITNYAPTS